MGSGLVMIPRGVFGDVQLWMIAKDPLGRIGLTGFGPARLRRKLDCLFCFRGDPKGIGLLLFSPCAGLGWDDREEAGIGLFLGLLDIWIGLAMTSLPDDAADSDDVDGDDV